MSSPHNLRIIRRLFTVGLVELMFIRGIFACDVCLQPPSIPFAAESPEAIEIAMATRNAIDNGEIDLNARLADSLNPGRQVSRRLNEVSAQQLIKMWAQTQPARRLSDMRITIDIVFIDIDKICHLDFRSGAVLYDADQSEPGEIRLLTTKVGFYRMLSIGIESCEQRQLAFIDQREQRLPQALSLLFPSHPLVEVCASETH